VRDAHDLADLGSGRQVLAGDRGHCSAQIHDEAPNRASFDLYVHESEVPGEVQGSLTREPFLDVHGPPRLQRDREVARLEGHLPCEQIDCRAWIRLAGAALDVEHTERSVRSHHAYTQRERRVVLHRHGGEIPDLASRPVEGNPHLAARTADGQHARIAGAHDVRRNARRDRQDGGDRRLVRPERQDRHRSLCELKRGDGDAGTRALQDRDDARLGREVYRRAGSNGEL
jgi:hypothetical protein